MTSGRNIPDTCDHDGCVRPIWIKKRKLCRVHYRQWYYQTTRPPAADAQCQGCGVPVACRMKWCPICKTSHTRKPSRQWICHECGDLTESVRSRRFCGVHCKDKYSKRVNGYRSGRNVPRAARKNAALVLAASDLCHLCGHHGSRTADHIIPARQWPRGPDGRHLPGLDDVSNLAPAHGTGGSRATGWINPCPTCGRLCNQSRGSRPLPTTNRRPW